MHGLGGVAADALRFGAAATKIILRAGFFGPTLIEVVTDLFALEADEIQAVDAFVDFLAVQHPAPKFLDADAEEFFVAFLDLAPAGFVAWKIFVVYFFGGAFVEVGVRAFFRRSSDALLLCSWHGGFSLSAAAHQGSSFGGRALWLRFPDWFYFIMNGPGLVNTGNAAFTTVSKS